MTKLIEPLYAGAAALTEAMVNSAWQGCLAGLLIWGILRAFPRMNAASRFWAWGIALVAVTALPVVLGVRALAERGLLSHRTGNFPAVVGGHRLLIAGGTDPDADWHDSPQGRFPLVWRVEQGMLPVLVVAGWGLGTLTMLGRLTWGGWRLRALKRAAGEVPTPLAERFAEWQEESCPGRAAQLLTSAQVKSPMAVGFGHPAVMVPLDLAERLTPEEFSQVCRHELGHLRRRDDWTNLFLQILRAVGCGNPAVLWIVRQMVLEREIACDDLVISTTRQVKRYALCLTRLAEITHQAEGWQLAPGASLSQTQLSRRVGRLLDGRRDTTGRLARGRLLAVGGVLAALVLWCVEMRPAVAVAEPVTVTTTAEAAVKVKVETEQTPAPAAATPPQQPGVGSAGASAGTGPGPVAAADTELLKWDAIEKELVVTNGQARATFFFAVTNISEDTEVVITAVKTSCGCTVAKMPSVPWVLKPHEDGKIDVSVDLLGKSGVLLKQISIVSTNAEQTLNVKTRIPELPDAMRLKNLEMANADPQAIFKGDCARCHVAPARSKIGKELYVAACGICHESPQRATMVPDLHQLNHPADLTFWRGIIREGKPKTLMPGFDSAHGGPFTEAQVESLAQVLAKVFPGRPAGPNLPVSK